jgi:tetratricopeptide (TPR) repeat protein
MEGIKALFAQIQDNPSPKLEHKLWKDVYSSIKQMRSSITDETRPFWLDYINSVSLLYNDLITYQINSNPSKPIWAKSFNCLGDLARYSIHCLPADQHQLKWTQAKSFYQAALCIQPKNGLFFNQIGICSNAQRCHLEAIVLFSRSLLIPAPFVNAREPLLMSFEKLENFGLSLLLGVKCDPVVVDIEICLGKIGKLLISKINVESAPALLKRAEDLFNLQFDLPPNQSASWWFNVAQLVICVTSLIPQNIDESTRFFMENIGYDLAEIVLLAALSNESASSQLCTHLMLAWIIARTISKLLVL